MRKVQNSNKKKKRKNANVWNRNSWTTHKTVYLKFNQENERRNQKKNAHHRKVKRANKLQRISLWAFEIMFAFESRSEFRACCLPNPKQTELSLKFDFDALTFLAIGCPSSCKPYFKSKFKQWSDFYFSFSFVAWTIWCWHRSSLKLFWNKIRQKWCQTIEINRRRAK